MEKPPGNIKEVARLFLKLGFTAFGGPAVHIAMMRNEVVDKLKWMNEQSFLDLMGATNLVPGPTSTEMAIIIGQKRAGWKGLIIGGLCFIMPAVIITGIIAWLYKLYGTSPNIQPYVYGIKPAVIVVILCAIYPLAKKSLKSFELGIIGVIGLVLCILGYNQFYIMFGSGFLALALTAIRNYKASAGILPFALVQVPSSSLIGMTNTRLFFTFLKIGSILYGSGYVLFAFLDSEFVQTGFLHRQQLIDAIAVGQFTPGPVFSSVTFVGYQLNGIQGAVLGTVAIFLPAFLFVGLLGTAILKLRESKLFSSFLDAVNIASIAIILSVCYELGKDSLTDWRAVTVAIMSLIVILIIKKLNMAWIILGGAIVGYLLTFV
ncbi:MAG: chromate efflux transporter [Bacteroidia bacterium]